MRRLSDERGAVGVVVALVMVPLIAFAAISLDVAAMYWEKQQLQTGADAAALAIAQDCGGGSCGTPSSTAQDLAVRNSADVGVTAVVVGAAPVPTTGQVTVRTSGVSQHAFAPVLGLDATQLSAQSIAAWGAPSGGTAVLPLAFSWCEFLAQTGGGLPSTATERVIHFAKTSGTSCTGPSGNAVPGGFGWLQVTSGSCRTTSAVGDTLYSSTGASMPTGCSLSDFVAVQNKTVLLPLFDAAGDTGSNAFYHVYGYAAFTVTGYDVGGTKNSWQAGDCRSNDRCVKGYFTRFVSLTEAFTYSTSAPVLGASVVKLTS